MIWLLEPVYIPKGKAYKVAVVLVVVVPFLAVLAAIGFLWNSYVFPMDIALLAVFVFFVGIGVTMGYHRMLTHQSFQTIAPIKVLLLIFGCMAFEGGPVTWAATHIFHHAHSDEEDDPHSPLNGFWHAHMGWLFRGRIENPAVFAPHLLKDPIVMFVERLSWLWITLTLVIPFLVGGWTGLFWGGLVRIFLVNHMTFSVNSVCHTFGKRDFETGDESRNNWVVGLLGFGEGWHNNHHAFPRNAFHGMKWYQFDLSGLIIRLFEKVGLVWDVQRVTDEVAEAHRMKGMTMYETMTEMKNNLGSFIDTARHELTQMMLKLPPEKVAAARLAYEQTMKRYADIQLYLQKRRVLKKAAVLRREREVAELFAVAKQKLALMAASSAV